MPGRTIRRGEGKKMKGGVGGTGNFIRVIRAQLGLLAPELHPYPPAFHMSQPGCPTSVCPRGEAETSRAGRQAQGGMKRGPQQRHVGVRGPSWKEPLVGHLLQAPPSSCHLTGSSTPFRSFGPSFPFLHHVLGRLLCQDSRVKVLCIACCFRRRCQDRGL